MAVIAFQQEDGQQAFVVFDATVKESHKDMSDVTDHPVESGANVTDHVRPKPNAIEINGIVSDSPIRAIANLNDSVTGETQSNELELADGSKVTYSALSFDGTLIRSKNVYDELVRLMNEAILVELSTSIRDYDSLVIEEITVDRDANTINSIAFRMKLKRVEIVEVNVGDFDSSQLRGQRRRNSNQNKGPSREYLDERANSLRSELRVQVGDLRREIGNVLSGSLSGS